MFPLTVEQEQKIVIQYVTRALHFDLKLTICVNYEIKWGTR
jgi:hypothetical protein